MTPYNFSSLKLIKIGSFIIVPKQIIQCTQYINIVFSENMTIQNITYTLKLN